MANTKLSITQLMGSEQDALDLYMNIMASYMLLSVANDYMNDATEMLEKRGLKVEKTKFLFNNAQKMDETIRPTHASTVACEKPRIRLYGRFRRTQKSR